MQGLLALMRVAPAARGVEIYQPGFVTDGDPAALGIISDLWHIEPPSEGQHGIRNDHALCRQKTKPDFSGQALPRLGNRHLHKIERNA